MNVSFSFKSSLSSLSSICGAMAFALVLAFGDSQAQIKHRFLAVDNGKNKLLLVDQIGTGSWSITIPAGSRDLQRLSGNKVLVSHGNGAAEYDLTTGAKGWSVTGYSNITTAVRLPNGNTLLGGNNAGITLVEIGEDKSVKSTLNIPALADLRLARRLDNGNTLLGLATAHKLVEVNASGTTVWSATLTDKGYVGHRLANGHTIATSGEDCRIYDVAPNGTTTLLAGGLTAHPSTGLLWFSGFEILPNGNFFVANWNGHEQEGKGPHAVEFDAQNNLVWEWADHVAASTVTNILTVEGAGPSALRSEVAPRVTGAKGFAPAFKGRKDVLGRKGRGELFRD